MSVTCVVVDDGEPNLERCLLSLRNQSIPVTIIVASGPKTNLEVAKKYADKVMPPTKGIGKARVKAILEAETEYIVSADSDTVYDKKYCEYALEDLKSFEAVKAGSIRPLEDDSLGWVETAFSLAIPYEYALAFRKSSFIKYRIHEYDYSDPRADIGSRLILHTILWPDFRMQCWSRLPTKAAVGFTTNYLPSLIFGTIPLACVGGILGYSELYSRM